MSRSNETQSDIPIVSDAIAPMLVDRIAMRALGELRPDPRNPRNHPLKQIAKIADSIRRFGFLDPILVDPTGLIIAGHGRLLAARQLGLTAVPTVCAAHLSEIEYRAYRIADNKLADLATWDRDRLRIELESLQEAEFDLSLTGFEIPEIEMILDPGQSLAEDDGDKQPDPGPAVTRPGDLWSLGAHRLYCGSALEAVSYAALMGAERAAVVFADPPYNVRVNGHVSGKGRARHPEFAMASGEMTQAAFTDFLSTTFAHLVAHSVDGSIHFQCMDWRHMQEMLAAAEGHYELKNLCVWAKDNGGMGSLYRSQHEMIFVFKAGHAPHRNNVELGKHGRNRTNVWQYPGQNTFHRDRAADLAAHPTVKPLALVADALRDVSVRGDLVLDPFCGSGTTLMAAERTRRQGRGIELDPAYVDVALRRLERLTGEPARLAATGQTFADVASLRAVATPDAANQDQDREESRDAA